ncbi:MAG: SDR family oxidoreductase [Ignavibacteriaceae bacterium]|nr:SDR family oxidoreductase [Ignavibacteriaceae bacterium]NUM72307.1 SDR family oxidoreductase [Ignavibacteriaceae bacterium]
MSGNQNSVEYALVLGASSGFGGATALRLAQDGYNVIGVHFDRAATMPNAEKIISEIRALGREARFYNVNAADLDKRDEILDDLDKHPSGKPQIKVLLHSLAFGTLKPFVSFTEDKSLTKAQMEMTLDVMAHSLVYWTQALVERGFLARKARIFALTSSGSHAAIPYYGAVSAAKAAIESHIRQLAVELGPLEVSCTSIMAGVTDTPALRKIPGSVDMIDVARRKNPRGRLTTPEDVAKVISLLCQDGGEWINGGLVHVDGGEDIVNYVGQNSNL